MLVLKKQSFKITELATCLSAMRKITLKIAYNLAIYKKR